MINSYLKQYPDFTVVKLGYCPIFGFSDIPPVRFLTKKIILELLPVIDPVYRHYANKRLRPIQRYQFRYLLLARIRGNEDALLQLVKIQLTEMLAQNIAEPSLLFRDIEYDDTPFLIPSPRILETDRITEKGSDASLPLPLIRKHKPE